MKDVIYREDAIAALGECPYNWNDWPEEIQAVNDWMLYEEALKNVPSVDAVVVKHGQWVKVNGYATPGGDPVWKCSECGKGIHVYGIEHGTYGKDVADGQWVSCPNCGAYMIGETLG